MAILGDLLIQTLYYAIVMGLSIGLIALLMRGFFWKYLKVKTSFGKYFIVKVRTTLRDYFLVGWVQDGFLIFKQNKIVKRISLKHEPNPFYRTLGVNWVDIDEEKGAICKPDYSTVTGHDLETEGNLYVRAVTKPSVADNQQRIMLLLLLGIGIGIIAVAFLSYSNYGALNELTLRVAELASKGVTVGGGSGLV